MCGVPGGGGAGGSVFFLIAGNLPAPGKLYGAGPLETWLGCPPFLW